MERRVFAGLAATIALAFSPTPATAQQSGRGPGGLSVPLVGMVNGVPATGSFKINRFGLVGKDVMAFGTATLNYATNVAVIATAMKVQLPGSSTAASFITEASALAAGTAPAATCDILHLTLGPLHLELLGLVVDLNQLQLDIVAQSGSGILGDLLCAVANLLNSTNLSSLLQQLVNALNNLIAAL